VLPLHIIYAFASLASRFGKQSEERRKKKFQEREKREAGRNTFPHFMITALALAAAADVATHL